MFCPAITIILASLLHVLYCQQLEHHDGREVQDKSDAYAKQKYYCNLFDVMKITDLSHPLENGTLHWPSNKGFIYRSQVDGERMNERNKTYYLKSDGFEMAVHCGTHLDAPRHFSKTGWTVDEIPLDRLINVPVQVIDLSSKVASNRSYGFVKDDFFDQNSKESLVIGKSVLLVYTGLSHLYDQGAKAYMGTDANNMTEMRIPGFTEEAAQYLVDVGVFGVGLDAPSADSSERHGLNNTLDPVAHTIFTKNNIYILENISKRLSELVHNDKLVRLTIAPLAIRGGSGSPIRLVAVTFRGDCATTTNSASSLSDVILVFLAIVSVIPVTVFVHSRYPGI